MVNINTMPPMIVGKLSISFDRGVKQNSKEDLALAEEIRKTTDGGVVRGYGTHFRSEEAKEFADKCTKEEKRLRKTFAQHFAKAPIPGLFVTPDKAAARRLLNELSVDPDVSATLQFFDMGPNEPMTPIEIQDWAKKIEGQIKEAPVGRESEVAKEGLDTIERLASCPLLNSKTAENLRELVRMARITQITRVEFRRKLSAIPVSIGDEPAVAPVSPRRTPALV